MKKIVITLIFTVLSYIFIFYSTGYNGEFMNDLLQQISGNFLFGVMSTAIFGTLFAYIYIAFKYSRSKQLTRYERLFFQLYSPWAILGYTIILLLSLTNPNEEFSLVFNAYSTVMFISIMIIITVNIVSLRATLEPDSGFAKINMKLILMSDILLIMICFMTIFIFMFNNTL